MFHHVSRRASRRQSRLRSISHHVFLRDVSCHVRRRPSLAGHVSGHDPRHVSSHTSLVIFAVPSLVTSRITILVTPLVASLVKSLGHALSRVSSRLSSHVSCHIHHIHRHTSAHVFGHVTSVVTTLTTSLVMTFIACFITCLDMPLVARRDYVASPITSFLEILSRASSPLASRLFSDVSCHTWIFRLFVRNCFSREGHHIFAWRTFSCVLLFLDVCNTLAEALPDTKAFFGDTKAFCAEPCSRQESQGRFLKGKAFLWKRQKLCSYGKKRKLWVF